MCIRDSNYVEGSKRQNQRKEAIHRNRNRNENEKIKKSLLELTKVFKEK